MRIRSIFAWRAALLTAVVMPTIVIAAARSAPALELGGWLTAADCKTCHVLSAHLSHPVDLAPTMAVPDDLPLDRGRLSCLTCHEVRTGEGSHAPLRRPAAVLCAACHDSSSKLPRDVHAIGLGRAHFDPDADSAEAEVAIDPESRTCLSCHDGALARGDALRLGPSRRPGGAVFVDGQHPIGVEQRSRGSGDHLRPAEAVDHAIRLYEGRVGCGSCHSVFARRDHLLVVDNLGSKLCLGCHDM